MYLYLLFFTQEAAESLHPSRCDFKHDESSVFKKNFLRILKQLFALGAACSKNFYFHSFCARLPELYLYPPSLDAIIENESCQISDPHTPHSNAGCDNKHIKVLFLEFYITNHQC